MFLFLSEKFAVWLISQEGYQVRQSCTETCSMLLCNQALWNRNVDLTSLILPENLSDNFLIISQEAKRLMFL